MIFVTLGTLHFPFDRLLHALEGLPGDEELIVQCRAPGRLPAWACSVPDLPFDELVKTMRAARVVVCHAGVGSVLTALANGKRPVTVPRLARLGEAVDDRLELLVREHRGVQQRERRPSAELPVGHSRAIGMVVETKPHKGIVGPHLQWAAREHP